MLNNSLGNPLLRKAVRTALAGGTVAASMGTVHAQTPPSSVSTEPSALEEVVVTGSRLAVPNQLSISPVTFVSSQDVQQSGVTRIEDLLNQLPQVFADQGSNISNGSDGTATINLRGLNAKRTLVLVDGLRLGPGDPTTGGAADINMIPTELVESVEVLTGGASSTYGADAVAGVVNFKLQEHFEGVKIVADAGIFSHNNKDVGGVEEDIAASGFEEAPSHVNTGAQRSIAFLAGLNSPDEKGNATFYATYRNVLPVLESKYSYSACTLGSGYIAGSYDTGGSYYCGGSSTSYPGRFTVEDINGVPVAGGVRNTIGPGGTLVPFTDANLYNYGATNYFQRPDERYSAGAFIHYDFNDHASFYAQTMYMNDKSVAQIAPGGIFVGEFTANCANPFFSAVELATWCGGATAGTTTLLIGRRDVEGGGRQSSFEHTDFHEVIGLKGKIDDAWSYDTSFQYSLVDLTGETLNYFDTTKITNSLNVVASPTGPVCVSGPPCVPYNIFSLGGVTQAAVNYLDTIGLQTGSISQTVADLDVTGDLGKYGVQAPTAASGLKVNVGYEYRDVKAVFSPDAESQSGDLSGTGGPATPVNGGLVSREGFVEARMPLVEDKFLAKELAVEAGYRYSSYSQGFKTNTYKFGVEFSPIEDLRLRGSFQRAVRAPNVIELFAPAVVSLDGTISNDPCAGPHPSYSAAACARTGVTAAQYGNVEANSANQYNGLQGGNTGLGPETALTTSFGVGYTPSYVPGLRLQVDFYNIVIENVIQTVGATNILTQCLNNGVLCGDIHRDALGSLWLLNSGYITDSLLNVGKLQERGVDLDVGYSVDLGRGGKLRTNLVGTYIDEYEITPIQASSATAYNCAGLYGPTCSSSTTGAGIPVFRWRHTLRTTWSTPWEGLDISMAWRYFASVREELTSANPNLAAPGGGTVANGGISSTDAKIPSYYYIDLSAAVKVADKLTVRVGCNNIVDKNPPIIGSSSLPGGGTGPANGNTFPQVYDSLGRYFFAQVIAQF